MNQITNIKIKPCGPYETNCYIVEYEDKSLIIDPGVGALEWIKKETTHPIAILNTHCHFDHVWDNQITKKHFSIPIYTPKDDLFMIQDKTSINNNVPPSEPDVLIDNDNEFFIGDITVKFVHLPGHTPGTSIIVIDDYIFSGDFVFANSIGRCDFPYSSPSDMKKSIHKFTALDFMDKKIFPGHGSSTTLYKEQDNIVKWLDYI